jgi:hypothetical protein
MPGKLVVDPLKYRGVFDYPHNQSTNLLPRTGNSERDAMSKVRKVERSTSLHVLEFKGWESVQGHRPKYNGEPATTAVLSHQVGWMQRWIQWSWFEDGEEFFKNWWMGDVPEERMAWAIKAQNAFMKAVDGPRREVTALAKDYLNALGKGDWLDERRKAAKEAAIRKEERAKRAAAKAGETSEEREETAAEVD